MTTSTDTQGIITRRGPTAWRQAVELLSSMRFAIALLTVICIASVIGTVMVQHEAVTSYVNQFGPFWTQLFLALKLNAVYSAWWFMLILAFLVVSTSLCIARHTPKYLADMRNFKLNIRERNLRAFGHRAEAQLLHEPSQAAETVQQKLSRAGWRVRMQPRDTPAGTGYMVAAKKGAANKIGYIAAHSAIVLICLGGLFDGDLMVRAMTWIGGKSIYTGSGFISEITPEHRLSTSNPTFRGDLVVPEGRRSNVAILRQSDGIVLQDLPFSVELEKFTVEYYSTGMPKLFASDIIIHDLVDGSTQNARVEVNHPVSYKGVQIYQSSFDDGGSRVKLQAIPLHAQAKSFTVEGVIGGSSEITNGEESLSLEYTALRTINVENLSDAGRSSNSSGTDVRRVDLVRTMSQHLGAADKTASQRELRNVGPSISYKLRDASGQATEYNNYMLPIDMGDGIPVYLLGVRESDAEGFRYLRIPADDELSMDGFIQLNTALRDPALREAAVQRYAAHAVGPDRPELTEQLKISATRVLDLFAGVELPTADSTGGLTSVSQFIETMVPEAERERAAEVLLRLLNGSLFELNEMTRAAAGKPPLNEADDLTRLFMTQSVFALSDAPLYPAPVAFQLDDFEQVQASVFQVARAPGKNVVYLGCVLLIFGIFAMLYIRDRRLWVWLAPEGTGSKAMMAYSANRKTMDTDREFEHLRSALLAAPSQEGVDAS